MQIQEYVPLSPLTTFHIGGPARFFVSIRTVDELCEALIFAQKKKLRIFVLGGGSNVLIDDTGFDGLVIQIALKGVEWKEDRGHTLVIAGAGESWDAVVDAAVKKNLWGIENLSSIPGTVGGAVIQNIGAYGAALSQTLQWIEVFDTTSRQVKKLLLEECQFGYRGSIFKHQEGRYVVLRAALNLSAVPNPNLSYKDLAERFTDVSATLSQIRMAILEIRRNKFPDLLHEGTAGSFFKNPVLPAVQAHRLQKQYPEMPLFTLPESTDIKIPLAWFLDYRHGIIDMRNMKVGGARMYEKQFLVLVVQTKSSSNDVKELAHRVTQTVQEKIGITIEPEVRILS